MSNFTESYFWGPIGKSCEIHSGETSAGCTALGQEITTCQAAGKKVLLSIGGFAGQQSLSTSDNAKSIANNIWGAFANPADTDGATTVRPFGDAYVNGFDFDYEQGDTNTMANLPTLISQLRANIGSKTTYLITGAPECGIPSPFMDSAVLHAQFDILWPQFYNCAGAAWSVPHPPHSIPTPADPHQVLHARHRGAKVQLQLRRLGAVRREGRQQGRAAVPRAAGRPVRRDDRRRRAQPVAAAQRARHARQRIQGHRQLWRRHDVRCGAERRGQDGRVHVCAGG